jgi:recombination protein RecA
MANIIPSDKYFDAMLRSLEKNFGAGYNTKGLADPQLKGIPTGYDDLDCLLTRGTLGLYKGGIVEIMGSEGSGKCVTKDTYCLTPYGMLTIEEIFERNNVPMKAIKGFDECEFPLVNENGEVENTSHFYRNGYGTNLGIWRIETKAGFEISGTRNHPIRVLDKNGWIVWRKLGQLQMGDVICIKRGTRIWSENPSISVDEASLLGLLIGDGNFTPKCRFGFTNTCPGIVRHFKSCMLSVFGSSYEDKLRQYNDDYHFNNTPVVTEFREKHGIPRVKACEKTVPVTVRCASKDAQAAFIRSYFDADGTFQFDKGNLQISSCSWKLLQEVQLMLLNYGIYAYKTVSHNQHYDRDYYELELAGSELKRYFDEIGFNENEKTAPIIKFITTDDRICNTNIDTIPYQHENIRSLYDVLPFEHRNRETLKVFSDLLQHKCDVTYSRLNKILADLSEFNHPLLDLFRDLKEHNYVFSQIANVERLNERTFDFTMPETHSFWSNGIISHNSSMALRTIGNAQKMGMHCCWFDAESAFDEALAVLNGVDPTKLILPELAEIECQENETKDLTSVALFNVNQVLEMFYQTIISNVFDLVVLDSVAGLAPERILQDDFYKDPDKAGVAEVARAMSQMLKKIAPACRKTETTAIFINQLRDQPGAYVQNRYHTPGGRALKFFAHQRISVEKVGGEPGRVWSADDSGQKELIGHYARCTIVKNKKAPPVQPGTEIEVPIYYREYFPDNAKKVYDLARKLQVITIRNGTLTWKEDNDTVLSEKGESLILAKIRDSRLEARLADACVKAADSEKNKSLKFPIRVSSAIAQLSTQNTSTVAVANVPETKQRSAKSKNKLAPAIDLD